MSGQWKPGQLAMVTARWIRTEDHSTRQATRFPFGWRSHLGVVVDDHETSEVRPLAVIDPESDDDVTSIANLIRDCHARSTLQAEVDWLAVQRVLRAFAAPTPPRPDEPTGLGAVIEDTDGRRWVRSPVSASDKKPWETAVDNASSGYADIDVVLVLSEGVTA